VYTLQAFVLIAFLYITALFSSHAVLLAPSPASIQPPRPLVGLNSPPAPRIAIGTNSPKPNSLQTMEKTMDTDYGLPIPMYRPFIMVDPRFDSPLPFRCCLNQVTELTAENSTPYQLPKEQRLSRLEKLPFEVREQVYHYTINQSQACFWSEWHVVDVKRPLGHTLHCGGRIVFCNRLSVFSLYNRQCKPSLRANFRIQTTMFLSRQLKNMSIVMVMLQRRRQAQRKRTTYP
jgi:hypothetical protein